MNKLSRSVLAVASLALVVTYFTPLWRITLVAPQYPEGLGLRIMLNTVKGQKPHDLNNINNLNHYIGMKRIEPDAIPELKIMPWAIGFLIGFGLLAAALGSRRLLVAWAVLFVVLSIAGLIDFWLWEYDYGHNLDLEHAAIKVPGMSYQPPLIGSKQLLNFTAHSWPGLGGWVTIASAMTGVILAWLTVRRRMVILPVLILLAAPFVAACQPAPEPFVFGTDQDAYCRMTITDDRFASQIVLKTGKVLKFDSIECMGRYVASDLTSMEDIHSIWLTDFDEPGTLIAAADAEIVQSDRISSPMGGGFAAVRIGAGTSALAALGDRMTWDTVVSRLRASTPFGRTSATPHAGH